MTKAIKENTNILLFLFTINVDLIQVLVQVMHNLLSLCCGCHTISDYIWNLLLERMHIYLFAAIHLNSLDSFSLLSTELNHSY